RTNADCPVGDICINGTCYPQCDPATGLDCASGLSCTTTCATSADCAGDLLCDAGACVASSFSCVDTTKTHTLSYGTTAAAVNISTTQNASCRYELRSGPFDSSLDILFSAMPDALSTSDSLNHSASVAGLFTGYNTVYVKCEDSATKTIFSSCAVSLTVGDDCTLSAQCDAGWSCINGFCEAPVCANAQPQGALPYSTLTTGTTIDLDTSAASTCVYGGYDNAAACNASVASCLGMTLFSVTGGTMHSSFLAGSSLVLGNDTKYVRCEELAAPNTVSPVCRIPFSVALCNADFQCAVGSQCVSGRCEPPACANAAPSGKLPYTTAQVDLGLTTDVNASCGYSTDYYAAFARMTLFNLTGFLSHQAFSVPVAAGTNTEYVKCQETVLGTEQSCRISFDVGTPCTSRKQCDTGWSCTLGRCLPPVCDGAYPSGEQTVDTTVDFGLTTAVASTCKWANGDTLFDAMTNLFSSTGGLGINHISSALVVSGNNTKYVGCQQNTAPNAIRYCRIPYNGGSCATGYNCEIGFGCDVGTGSCDDCSTNPLLSGCKFIPPPPPGGCSDCRGISPVDPSCNTLGYTFTGTAVTPAGHCDLVAIILALLSWMAWLIALLAVLSGLRAAYLYITAMGDEKRLNLAKSYLLYTTIGVGVAVLTFGIVAITRAILNI
ncbi:hypothetical protein HY250_03800, partial [Candidatus Azambacteria bacterium]|nr:hypothetical protein [Candidatus Azambacteria bacterium]